jgi:hypothetical protein
MLSVVKALNKNCSKKALVKKKIVWKDYLYSFKKLLHNFKNTCTVIHFFHWLLFSYDYFNTQPFVESGLVILSVLTNCMGPHEK